MAKDTNSGDTQPQLPAIKPSDVQPDPDHPTVKGFASRIEDVMNEAVTQSIPAPNTPKTEHHQRFAKWANHLGDLWREVKQHV